MPRPHPPDPDELAGRVCVITGPTSGIGRVTAFDLARRSAGLILACRNLSKGDALKRDIADETGNHDVHVVHLDLDRLDTVEAAATAIRDLAPEVHVLVNNAGFYTGERALTDDGYERTFQVNHLGPFHLTRRLLPNLEAAAGARVVNVASHAHYRGRIHWNDPMLKHAWGPLGGWRAYCQSKLANILFTNELARRTLEKDVTANSLHPGLVRSGFAMNEGAGLTGLLARLGRPVMVSPERGAQTSIYLATSPDVADVTGAYFSRCRPITPSRHARNEQDQKRLWELSEQFIEGARTLQADAT